MKTLKWTFTATIAIFGIFAFIGCGGDNGNGGGGDKDLSGNITISPNIDVLVNMELTANYSGGEAVNYQWNKGGSAIGGKNDQTFTPAEAGSYTVTVSLAGYKSKTSAAVAVTAVPVLEGTVTIEGTVKVGETLTVSITGSNAPDDNFTYQ